MAYSWAIYRASIGYPRTLLLSLPVAQHLQHTFLKSDYRLDVESGGTKGFKGDSQFFINIATLKHNIAASITDTILTLQDGPGWISFRQLCSTSL